MGGEPGVQFLPVVDLGGAAGAHAAVGLGDDGEAGLLHEGLDLRRALRALDLPGGRDAAQGVVFLHLGLVADRGDAVALDAGGHVEVRAQAGVLRQPEFVVGLDPVDLAVFVGHPGHGAVHLVVILEVADLVIVGQRGAQLVVQLVILRIGDAQHVHAVAAQARAEMAVGLREVRRNEYDVHKAVCFVFGRDLPHGSVRNLPGQAVQRLAAVFGEDVAPVGEGVEGVTPAFREDDVLEEALAVQHHAAHLVVVRHKLALRQAEALQPARVVRVDGFAGQLGMGEDALRAIHRACAAAHHQPVEAAQQFLEADFVQETVLRGHVAAAEHDPVGVAHQVARQARVAPVQHRHAGRRDTGVPDAGGHGVQHGVRESPVVRRRADQQHARRQWQRRPHGGEQPVVFSKAILPEAGRTSG